MDQVSGSISKTQNARHTEEASALKQQDQTFMHVHQENPKALNWP
jgi:hypothetical protein